MIEQIDLGELQYQEAEKTEAETSLSTLIRAVHELLLRNPEEFTFSVRPAESSNDIELWKIVSLVQRNFREHPHYQISEDPDSPVNEKVLAKYLEANSFENLRDSMNKENAYPFVVEQDGDILGFILCKVDEAGRMRVHRLHSSLLAQERGVHGVGKMLLNMAAITAKRLGITTLTSTASYPAKDYFERMGWDGLLEKNEFPLDNELPVILTQFRCFFQLNDDFEGF